MLLRLSVPPTVSRSLLGRTEAFHQVLNTRALSCRRSPFGLSLATFRLSALPGVARGFPVFVGVSAGIQWRLGTSSDLLRLLEDS